MNKLRQAITIILLFFPLLARAGESPKIIGLTIENANLSTQITVKFNHAIPHHVFTLAHPHRLVMDFENARLRINLKKIALNNTGIEGLREGHPVPRTLRLVFDLNAAPQINIISQPNDAHLMVTLKLAAHYLQKTISHKQVAAKKNVAPSKVQPIIVVIDPGHGGKDPGAIGKLGAREKDVVLAISKRLADLINLQPNMHAVLTRTSDHFVTLRNRLRRARKGNADLFVAIHADSFFNDQSTGASVYTLSQRGATSEAARWLARRENYSEIGDVNLRGLDDQSYVLRSVLIDMAQTATITNSLHLGTTILDQLDDVSKLHYVHVEQAPFMVLKSPDIPSVLVETGFISNPKEELKLRDKTYQEKIAHAIFEGVRIYLKKYNSTGVA